MDIIKQKSNCYDFWIVCAGELGRIYSGFIKSMGGRSIDMGFVLEYWLTGEIPERLIPFLKPNPENKLEFIFYEINDDKIHGYYLIEMKNNSVSDA